MNRAVKILEKIGDMTIKDFVNQASHIEVIVDELEKSKNGSIMTVEASINASLIDGESKETRIELRIIDEGEELNEK